MLSVTQKKRNEFPEKWRHSVCLCYIAVRSKKPILICVLYWMGFATLHLPKIMSLCFQQFSSNEFYELLSAQQIAKHDTWYDGPAAAGSCFHSISSDQPFCPDTNWQTNLVTTRWTECIKIARYFQIWKASDFWYCLLDPHTGDLECVCRLVLHSIIP